VLVLAIAVRYKLDNCTEPCKDKVQACVVLLYSPVNINWSTGEAFLANILVGHNKP